MPIIGIRELREKTSEVLRKVREEKAEYIVTHQGQPIALLTPVDVAAMEAAMLRAGRAQNVDTWEAYDRLMEEVRAEWDTTQSTDDLLSDIRR